LQCNSIKAVMARKYNKRQIALDAHKFTRLGLGQSQAWRAAWARAKGQSLPTAPARKVGRKGYTERRVIDATTGRPVRFMTLDGCPHTAPSQKSYGAKSYKSVRRNPLSNDFAEASSRRARTWEVTSERKASEIKF
jgi:hypothetical protein